MHDMCNYMRRGRVDIFNMDTTCKLCKVIMGIRCKVLGRVHTDFAQNPFT